MDRTEYTGIMNSRKIQARRERDARYAQLQEEGRVWGHIPREWIRQLVFPRLEKADLQFLRSYADTCAVADILDTWGLRGAISASQLSPVAPGQKIVGQAVTQRNLPTRETVTQGLLDHAYIGMNTKEIGYLAEAGDVLVVDNSGAPDVSCLGGMACRGYQQRGIAGAVVWGGVRDISSIRKDGFPVWSRGQTCVTGKYRIFAAEINGPVAVAAVTIWPGDLIVADDSGVCAVPLDRVPPLMEKLRQSLTDEKKMRAMIDSGTPLEEIRRADRAHYGK